MPSSGLNIIHLAAAAEHRLCVLSRDFRQLPLSLYDPRASLHIKCSVKHKLEPYTL